ncbi:hypothetical protein [Curtobacterium sp. VKM Ac-2852]|uniref:hypothetical protein n=1 Tax=Curtobacterium sp. VKM Ac-2852 TaxID=2739024 RepID=UPI001566439B|nr:hypothetical protein [Curtobacterium sp. VKM Ac-2852]NQX22721.1 hypothetical protein [Curtobacterium sp. VKM Ac-2852]
MTDSDILTQALKVYEERSQQEQAKGAARQARQQDLREGLVKLNSSVWSAHAAFILFDQNQPSRAPVQWEIPRNTAALFELTADGTELRAEPKAAGDATPFIVTAPLGDDVELVLELQTPNLEPVEDFLAVRSPSSRDYTQIHSLGDLGGVVTAMRGDGKNQR